MAPTAGFRVNGIQATTGIRSKESRRQTTIIAQATPLRHPASELVKVAIQCQFPTDRLFWSEIVSRFRRGVVVIHLPRVGPGVPSNCANFMPAARIPLPQRASNAIEVTEWGANTKSKSDPRFDRRVLEIPTSKGPPFTNLDAGPI